MIKTYIMDIRQLTTPEVFQKYYNTMPMERRKKIDSLRQEEDKRRSLAAGTLLLHGLLELNIKMESWESLLFCYGKNKKPYLKNFPQIQFNLSHAGNYAIAGFGTKELGIDIEKIGRNGSKISSRLFTSKEQEYLKQIKEKELWYKEFTRLWTRKESFVKAIGIGLSFGFQSIETLTDHADTPFHQQYQYPLWFFYEYTIKDYWITVCSQELEYYKELIWIT